MDIDEFTHDEHLALIGLVEQLVIADREASPDEARHVKEIVEAIGKERYNECLNEVDERFQDAAQLKDFVKTIHRQEARSVIYATLSQVALGETVVSGEAALLDWLADVWDLEVEKGPA